MGAYERGDGRRVSREEGRLVAAGVEERALGEEIQAWLAWVTRQCVPPKPSLCRVEHYGTGRLRGKEGEGRG
jgi:hypothetical protein